MKARAKPVWTYYLFVAVLLLGLVMLGSVFLTGTAPRVIRRVSDIPAINQDPTVIAEAMMAQEAIQYPGPVPTQPPGPGTPTPTTLEQVRNALKWSIPGSLLYVLQEAETIYVAFQPTHSIYGSWIMAQNTKGTVAAILGRISQFSGDYDYVVIQLGSQNERYLASANDSFRLVYDRATIQGRAWLESGDVYAFARQKDVPTAFLTTEPTESLPPTTSP